MINTSQAAGDWRHCSSEVCPFARLVPDLVTVSSSDCYRNSPPIPSNIVVGDTIRTTIMVMKIIGAGVLLQFAVVRPRTDETSVSVIPAI